MPMSLRRHCFTSTSRELHQSLQPSTFIHSLVSVLLQPSVLLLAVITTTQLINPVKLSAIALLYPSTSSNPCKTAQLPAASTTSRGQIVEVGKLGKRKNSLNGHLEGPSKKVMTVSWLLNLVFAHGVSWMSWCLVTMCSAGTNVPDAYSFSRLRVLFYF